MITVRGCRFPPDLFYHAGHNIWLRYQAPETVILGVTSFAVALAVDFLAFIPKPIGMEIEPDRAVGLLELAKTITSVRTPVAGVITASNDAAAVNPAAINKDPYDGGWLVKLKIKNWESARSTLVTGPAIAPAFEEAMRLENFEGVRR
jgi:glycine cleavage system H protein